MLVGAIVVQDGMDHLAGRHARLDRVEEADELLMAMALHAAAQNRPLQHVQRRKQGCGPAPFIVVGHGGWSARPHGRAGPGAAERLDLALLIAGSGSSHRWTAPR